MIKLLTYIQHHILAIANFSGSLVKIILWSKFRVRLPVNSDNTMLYLANGPSLPTALEKIKQRGIPKNIMVSNFFIFDPLYKELKPNHYIFCDPIFTTNEALKEESSVRRFYQKIFEETTWKLHLLVPFKVKSKFLKLCNTLHLRNDNIEVHFYNTVNFNGNTSLNFPLISLKLGMPRPTTVAIPAMITSIWMGYDIIYFAGIDLNQHQDIRVTKSNILELKSKHFYSGDQPVEYKPFYKNKDRNETFSISEIFHIFYYFYSSFDIVARYGQRKNITFRNFSEDSFLDQFKKE